MPQEESSVDVEREREGRLVSRIVDSAPRWIGRVPYLDKINAATNFLEIVSKVTFSLLLT